MAIKKNQEVTIVVKVEKGTTTAGKMSYYNRNFSNINPAITDDQVLSIGQGLASLQAHALGSVNRKDEAEIASA